MPAGYVIAQLKVTNPENYKEYIEKVTPIVKKFGGEYLARGGEYTVVEGEDNYPRIILIKFPSYEKALLVPLQGFQCCVHTFDQYRLCQNYSMLVYELIYL